MPDICKEENIIAKKTKNYGNRHCDTAFSGNANTGTAQLRQLLI